MQKNIYGREWYYVNDSTEIELKLKDDQGLILPPFPKFMESPVLPGKGSLKIENWNMPTVIDQSGAYDTLTVNTELQLDTKYGDLFIRINDLQLGSNASINVIGTGTVYLYVENDLYIRNGSRINGSGNGNNLELYHSGNRIELQGGVGGQEIYKFAGNIYTEAAEIIIQNGANFKGNLYAVDGNISIQGGITASALLYTRTGNITITGGARINGQLISGGERIEIYGGSSFDGSQVKDGLLAPDADIYLDQGAVIRGSILADSEKIHMGYINNQESYYKIPAVNDGVKYIEEVTVYSPVDNPDIYLYGQVDGNWIELYQKAKGQKSVIFQDHIQTNDLKISNPQGLPITEVFVKYSTENNQEPNVEILYPDDNSLFSQHEFSREKIIGYVDNPETEVTINGQEVYHRGHYFWIEAGRIGAGDNQIIQIAAVAKDNTAKVNYDFRNIYILNQDLIDVNISDDVIYTEEDTINVNGNIRTPLNQLAVNGEIINISGGQYNKEIELKEGLNLIKIEGSKIDWQGKKEFSRTIYRKIVKTTPIFLKVDSVLDGYYTNKNSIVISGMVDGIGELTVLVNGKEAVIDGNIFRSLAVDLEEGINTVSIEAFNNIDKREKEIRIIKDTIAPVLSNIIPEDAYIAIESLVDIKGEVSDTSPVQKVLSSKSETISLTYI